MGRDVLPRKVPVSHEEHVHPCINASLDFLSIIIAVAEISLVLYLSIDHFSHQQGAIAVAMLGPIFLNFVGVTYFLSHDEERHILEQGESRCGKDIFQMPLLGPVFTAIEVFRISAGISKTKVDYARMEAIAIKMRLAESFFGAAPEALIQLIVFLVSTEQGNALGLNQYLEMAIVILSVITLSEANMYALLSNYYRIFHKYKPEDWKIPHIAFWKKCILFCHAFFSLGSRIAAMACLKSAVKYLILDMPATQDSQATATGTSGTRMAMSSNQASQLGYFLIVFFILEIAFRMLLYYVVRLVKYLILDEGIPSGCYESINYGWRATILDFGFQSKNIAVQLWFYVENMICFILWWVTLSFEVGTRRPTISHLRDTVLLPLAAIFVLFTLTSVFLLFAATGLGLHSLKSPFYKKTKANINH